MGGLMPTKHSQDVRAAHHYYREATLKAEGAKDAPGCQAAWEYIDLGRKRRADVFDVSERAFNQLRKEERAAEAAIDDCMWRVGARYGRTVR